MKKCTFQNYSIFKNIYGSELKLYIYNLSSCLQITILSNKKSLYTKCILIFAAAIFNIIFLLFNIVTINVILGLLLLMVSCLYTLCTSTIEENLFIVKGLGIQITKRNVLGSKKVFYPQEQVQKVFINEVIFREKVLFILTLLVNDLEGDKLIPLFTDLLPQIGLLKDAYGQIKEFF